MNNKIGSFRNQPFFLDTINQLWIKQKHKRYRVIVLYPPMINIMSKLDDEYTLVISNNRLYALYVTKKISSNRERNLSWWEKIIYETNSNGPFALYTQDCTWEIIKIDLLNLIIKGKPNDIKLKRLLCY